MWRYCAAGNRDGAQAALERAEAIAARLRPQHGLHFEADLQRARELITRNPG